MQFKYYLIITIITIVIIFIYNRKILKENMGNVNDTLRFLQFNRDLKYYYNKILGNKRDTL